MLVQVGADWDKEKCVVAWRMNGKEHHGRVRRDIESVEAFVERLRRGLEHDDEELELEVGIESGDSFWFVLWVQAGADVKVFDGKKSHNFQESLVSSGARDDLRSARSLLAMLESVEHRKTANRLLGPEVRALLTALAAKNDAARELARLQNRLGAFLRQYHPALPSQGKILRGQWFMKTLLAAPTAAAWAELPQAEQNALLKGSSVKSRRDLMERLGRDLGAVHPVEEAAVRVRVRNAVIMLQGALEADRLANKALEVLLEEQAVMQQARQVEGIGDVIATGFGIAFGIAEARQTAEGGAMRDAAAVILGAAPVTQRSGTLGDSSPKAAMRRTTRPMLRAIPYLLGLQLIKRHEWAKAAFAYYKTRGKTTASAFRSIARSFLRVVGALVRDNAAFDHARYVKALKEKGVPWAAHLADA